MNVFVTSAIAAIVPLLIGFIYYHPKVLGGAWMKATGLTEESMKGGNMAVIFSLTLLLSYMMAIFLGISGAIIHQAGVNSLLAEGGPELIQQGKDFLTAAGTRYNTFKHGAFHGIIAALFFALPVLGINALFERKSGKYIFLHLGYWVITLALMGGVICQFTKVG
jgi:hypothetical protein